ncbi:helix-turn-helix transcriptional regulator [Streptomyces sp. NPDC002088]|uniref:response regulator transcription factor n=1 Tax=unclassified Streptomyces TaxID=2593676 RepID=UPI00331D813E
MEISGADARRVLELSRELEDATSTEEMWGRALSAVMELVPADSGQRYSFSLEPPTASLFAVPYETFHPDPNAIHEHPEDHPLTDALLLTTEPQAWRVSDVASDRQWYGTHCYNLDFRPFGMRRQIIANAAARPGLADGYALNRSGSDFSERERDLLSFAQLQFAGLERQLTARQRLLALSAAALELAGSQGCGLALIDESGRPQPLNAVAADLLSAVHDDPRLTGGTSFTTRDVEVHHIPPAAPGRPALLVLRDLARGRAVARLFGVTEQEHRTLRHLHSGRTATETAHRMGLSPTTVRGYIASLHRKLEVGHTAALLRRGRDLGLLTD